MSPSTLTEDPGKDANDPNKDKKPSFEPQPIPQPSKSITQPGDATNGTETSPGGNGSNRVSSEIDQSTPEEGINPGLRLRALVNAGAKSLPKISKSDTHMPSGSKKNPRGIWNIAAGFSMVVNAILLVILLIMSTEITNLKSAVSNVLGGLYGNLVQMDQASLASSLTLDSQLPLSFTIPIQQNVNLALTESISVPNAHIIINSGGLTINAPANITLPAGTNLPVALDLTVPVQVNIPISLQMPLSIPLSQSPLHQPLTSLQNLALAYTCKLDRNAQYPQGIYLCKDQDETVSAPGAP
jgi:hypothetical protein